MYINTTPANDANSKERRIRFAPTVNHHKIKNGFRPVKVNPSNKRFRVVIFRDFAFFLILNFRESRTCLIPKIRSGGGIVKNEINNNRS